MTEKEYHELAVDRYSSIKLFIEDKRKYHSKYIIRENFREDKTKYTIFGSLVDCLLFSPEDLDNRFVLISCRKPTGQMGDFVDSLWKRTIESLSESGTVTRSMDSLMADAYADVAFDKKGEKIAFKRKTLDQVIEDFIDSEAAEWYEQQRESVDKSLIQQEDLDNAHRVIDNLRSNFVTSDIINRITDNRYTILYQVIILFEYNGLKLKSMLDMLEVDHHEKTIRPRDLKTTYSVEEFDYNYKGYKYYIQAATYHEALGAWRLENNLQEYEIMPMEFIVTDSTNYMNPLIYSLTTNNLYEAYKGYTYNGVYYPGLDAAVSDLLWHKENNIWNISRANYENKGRRFIKSLGTYEYQTDSSKSDQF